MAASDAIGPISSMTRSQQARLRYPQPKARKYVELLDSANGPHSTHGLRKIWRESEALMRQLTNDEMAMATRLLRTMDREDAAARQK